MEAADKLDLVVKRLHLLGAPKESVGLTDVHVRVTLSLPDLNPPVLP